MRLNRVLVTGGTSGIGEAVVSTLLARGFVVCAASRRAENRQIASNHCTLTLDVTQDESVEQAVTQALQSMGGIDVLVHCAGFGLAGAAEDTPVCDAQAQMDTNFFGVVRVNRAVLPHMRGQGSGLVLGIGSVAGLIPIPFQAHYSASKSALDLYMQALRMEIAAYGISCGMILPGDLHTGFTQARKFSLPQSSPYQAACDSAVSVMQRDELRGPPPDCVARLVLRACLAGKTPPRRIVPGKYRLMNLAFAALPRKLALGVVAKMYQ